jgi:hypothetical protein
MIEDDDKSEWLKWMAGKEAVENLKQPGTTNALSEIIAFNSLLKTSFKYCLNPVTPERFFSQWCKNSCTA